MFENAQAPKTPATNQIICFKVNEKGFSPRPIALGAEAEKTAMSPNVIIKATTIIKILSAESLVYVLFF